MASFFFSRRYPIVLLCVLVVLVGLSAINVSHPEEFPFELIPTIGFIVVLSLTARRFPLSNLSYTLVFIYLCFHTLAGHYTYSNVPYNSWFIDYLHFDLNEWLGTTRNMYDRFVHFLFGLLLAYPAREVFMRVSGARGFWSFYFPLDIVMAFSMLYELFEWAVAVLYARADVAILYIGMQGDMWDAQKDMLCATIGAFIAMTIIFLFHLKYNRNIRRELADSMRVQDKTPHGEVRLRELLAERKSDTMQK